MSGTVRSSRWGAAAILTVACVVGWMTCLWPAWSTGGSTRILWMTIAAICCLIPGWIVVFLSALAMFRNQMSEVLVPTMVRLFLVAVTAILVRKIQPQLTFADFSLWLVMFYLLALAVEVLLLRRAAVRSGGSVEKSAESAGTVE
ncbi:MAG: hypothetical protein KDA85_16105 [Planctomycetaceae bacterium]|nr:hypothetical protein [Planctomycetaceae bacterium]